MKSNNSKFNRKEYMKQYYEIHKEKIRKQLLDCYKRKRDEKIQKMKQYYNENKEYFRNYYKSRNSKNSKNSNIEYKCKICEYKYPKNEMSYNDICYMCAKEIKSKTL